MRKPWQYTLLGAAIAFFILYGIELSSDGMEDVYGSYDHETIDRTGLEGGNGYGEGALPAGMHGMTPPKPEPDPYGSRSGDVYGRTGTVDVPGRDGYGEWSDRSGKWPGQIDGYGYPYDGASDSGGAVSRLADGTAGLLQSMAKSGIRFIVSLFESVTQ